MKNTPFNYNDLQNSIDILIGKFGLQKTTEVINSLVSNTALDTKDKDRIKLTTIFIISKSIEVFDLKEERFYTSTITEYKEARMVCFYLIKKYTKASHAKIGESFGVTKRAVLYHYDKCKDRLSIPNYHKPFIIKFNLLENNIINFIAKLN